MIDTKIHVIYMMISIFLQKLAQGVKGDFAMVHPESGIAKAV